MVLKQVRRERWVVYDANGKVVIMSRCKSTALRYIEQLKREKTPAIVVDA